MPFHPEAQPDGPSRLPGEARVTGEDEIKLGFCFGGAVQPTSFQSISRKVLPLQWRYNKMTESPNTFV